MFLRDYLVTDIHGSDHPTAQLLLEKVRRAARRNQSDMMRVAKEHARIAPYYSPGGIFLGNAVSAPFDGPRFRTTMARITRGLYYLVRRTHLSPDCDFDVRRMSIADFRSLREASPDIGNVYVMGDVATCIFAYAAEEPTMTVWWFIFYERICIGVYTSPPGTTLGTLVAS